MPEARPDRARPALGFVPEEVALAARARGEKSGLRELRMSYFQAYHDRGHLKTEDGLELDGELLDSY